MTINSKDKGALKYPARDAALAYRKRGWKPVPVPHKKKSPNTPEWQKIDFPPTAEHFTPWANIAIQFGAPSKGLSDIDLDCSETIALADDLLPPTEAVFGRRSKLKSHRLYVTNLHETHNHAVIKYSEPVSLARKSEKPATLVELRIGGGDKGAVTIFPPSIHPSGERLRRHIDGGEPAQIDGAELLRGVVALACGALLVRHYPVNSMRHEGALVLGGVLATRVHMDADDIEAFVSAVARAANDEEAAERGKSAADAVALVKAGKHTPGLPRMREVWGKDVADIITKWWLGITPNNTGTGTHHSDEEAITELARLDLIEYDRQRERASKRLGVRTSTLDNAVAKRRDELELEDISEEFLHPIEPWPEQVDGHDLLCEVRDVLNKHVIMPKGCSTAIALWILHAHAIDAAQHSPIIDVSSPTHRCGKTSLLLVIGRLTPKVISAANITPATIYRAIDAWGPTLLIDEVDTFLADKSELRGVLNSGHSREGAFVLRCVGDDFTPHRFGTWCPKVFAHIGRVHATLIDRSITIALKRKLKAKSVQRIPRDPDCYHELARKCARWALDNVDALRKRNPKVPDELNDRAKDNWEPLLAIAELCSSQWGNQARSVALILSGNDDDETLTIQLLRDLKEVFRRHAEHTNFSSAELINYLTAMEGHPWAEFSKDGKPITQTGIAQLLKPFNIAPKQVQLLPGNVARKVIVGQFKWAFERYVPVSTPKASL